MALSRLHVTISAYEGLKDSPFQEVFISLVAGHKNMLFITSLFFHRISNLHLTKVLNDAQI